MAQNIIRTYLKQVIGLGDNATGTIKANAFIEQGLDDITEIQEFSGSEEVKNLCAAVRKPGGQIQNPDSVAANTAAITANNGVAQANQIPVPPITLMPDPGQNIPSVCEVRLTLAAYGAKLYHYIGRGITPSTLSRSRLIEFRKHLSMVSNHEAPEGLPSLSRQFGIMKFLDQFPNHLRDILGVNKVALSYVLRDEIPPNNLPALVNNKPWSGTRASFMEELIAYAPHTGPEYTEDNAQVFTLLMNTLTGSQHVASISRFQSKRDGRGAFQSLVLHNMGSSKWEKIVESAEKSLSQRIWNGKNHRYPLKDHITRQREAFNDMERAKANIPYEVPNDTTRVRFLLNSITASEMTAAKNVIIADATKKNDFEATADYLLLVAPVKQQANPHHRVSALNHQNSDKRKRNTGGQTVEDRYYKLHEWRRLTEDQKTTVRAMRDARKAKKTKTTDQKEDPRISMLQIELDQSKHLIASLTSAAMQIKIPSGKPPALNPPPGWKKKE